MRYYKYIRIILISIPIIILGFLIYKYVCPRGVLKVDYDFCREDAFISRLSPGGRVLEIEKLDGYCQQKMVIDPVYFDVRLPQSFRQAGIKIWYQKNDDVILKIGPRFDSHQWLWDLKKVEFLENDGEWQVGVVDLDLNHVTMENNRIRFLVSSPWLDKFGEEILFSRVEIKFEKLPIGWGKVREKVKNLVKF